MYSRNLNFFYKTGIFIGGVKTMDTELNKFNLVFFLGRKKSFFVINYQYFIYNMRVSLFFLYRLISLRGKILAYDDRFYIRRCLIFFFKRANQNYIVKHWIGGTLTNFKRFRIFFLQILKGLVSFKKYYDLFLYYYGLKTMQQMPALTIFSNPNTEAVAFQETFRLGIPIISLIDGFTKNISGVTFPIPSNINNRKTLIIFYSILGDSLLYGLLRPVSYFFNNFLKRIKKIRKLLLFQQITYQKIYTNVFFNYLSKIRKKFQIKNLFFKNKFFYYFQKKKNFNLKFLFTYSQNKQKFLKKFFKNSFFILWSKKKIFKIKTNKKKRRKIFKKIFKYKRRLRRYKFFKIFQILKKKLHKILKKTYYYYFQKQVKRYAKLNYIIIYNKWKNQYKNKEINSILKKAEQEQINIEETLEKFDDLPEIRKIKKLKKLNENFIKLKTIYILKDLQILNKLNKINFVKRFNVLKIFTFKLRNKFIINKPIFKTKKKNSIKIFNIFLSKNFFIKFKNDNFEKYNQLDFFLKTKKNYLNLLKKRRKNNYFSLKIKKIDTISKINILYSRIEND